MAEFERSKEDVEERLNDALNRTLLEVDCNNAFAKTDGHPKVTGIAGDVIEQSVLGYPANSDQNPDLSIDGVLTEVKTTGIRYSTESRKKIPTNNDFEAKEPMSITAVSPETIVNETFLTSKFWEKLHHTLVVYYHYDSLSSVKSWDYKNFKVKGFDFHEFSDEDCEVLKEDWQKVQDYISDSQKNYPDSLDDRYANLSSSLRKNLTMIDTAPKWPKRPRFRLKRSAVSAMVHEHFSQQKYAELAQDVNGMDSLMSKLHYYGMKYRGKSVRELLSILGIKYKLNKKEDVTKSITQDIFLKMFGSEAKSISKIGIFEKAGITLKTIVTKANNGMNTEDTKLFPIDFDDLVSNDDFYESQFYNYFNDAKFLFINFEEHHAADRLLDNTFLGFKMIVFDDDIIENNVRYAWKHTRNLVMNDELREETCYYEGTNKPIYNKTNIVRTQLNFLKGAENNVFLRGTGNDSSHKPFNLNGIDMYKQYAWVKGRYISELLKQEKLI